MRIKISVIHRVKQIDVIAAQSIIHVHVIIRVIVILIHDVIIVF